MTSTAEIDVTRLRLVRIADAARALAEILVDLHSIGYEQKSRELSGVRSGEWSSVETVGDPVARDLFGRIVSEAKTTDVRLGALNALAYNFLTRGGPSPEPTRGSLVSKADFEQQKKNREKRRRDGEYAPVRHVPQPDYPGSDPPKNKRRKGKR